MHNINSIIKPHVDDRTPCQQWSRATITEGTQYKQCLDELLLLLEIPNDCIKCTDYSCTDYSHIVSIPNFHGSIIASCLEALKVIPISKKSKTIPGWNEHVERHKHISQFSHFI